MIIKGRYEDYDVGESIEYCSEASQKWVECIIRAKRKFLWWEYWKKVWRGSGQTLGANLKMTKEDVKESFEWEIKKYEELLDEWKRRKM